MAVLSPHAALGRDWELVVIAGLQDGLWPNTTPRGGVLGTQRLLDVLDGLGDDVSVRAPLLAEERRLLIAAMGRARSRLLVTAVDSDAGDEAALPSPFVAEFAAMDHRGRRRPRPSLSSHRRCCRPRRWSAGCARWCARLPVRSTRRTRLCRSSNWRGWPQRVSPGADPAQWYGMTAISTARAAVER